MSFASEQSPVVVGLGELLWDVFPDEKRPGGAPANVAFQAQQLGNQGLVVSRLGTDSLGEELLQFLQSKGLNTDGIQRDEHAPTGTVTVSFDERHQPSYIIHENVAWDRLDFTPQLQRIMESANAVCFGTLAQRDSHSRAAILAAVRATSDNCLRVYDVNLRQNYYNADLVRNSLKLATIVKLNDEEVQLLAPKLGLSSDEPEFAKQVIDTFGPTTVCLTRGAKGCCLVNQNEVVEIEARPIKVADTVGAGDAFTAGLITAILKGWSLKEAGTFANLVGGLVASHHGAMPELRSEFASLLQQFQSSQQQ